MQTDPTDPDLCEPRRVLDFVKKHLKMLQQYVEHIENRLTTINILAYYGQTPVSILIFICFDARGKASTVQSRGRSRIVWVNSS